MITPGSARILVDSRYTGQAERETSEFTITEIRGDVSSWFPDLITDLQCRKLGFEAGTVTYDLYRKLTDILKDRKTECRLVPTVNLVETIRMIKDPQETAFIREACALSDAALHHARSFMKPGMTEAAVAWELEKYLREKGGEAIPFEIIVACGPNAALAQHRSAGQQIEQGQPVVIDIGARVNGYCSDCTRTYHFGREDEKFRTVYDTVLGAQMTALSTIAAGMSGKDADSIARSIIETAGYGGHFGHSLGHGLGLDVHELPRLSSLSNDILANNMVFTVEPGIYIPEWGGVRIEDTVVLENGRITVLTHADKSPVLSS
jgi:Xaa-Pro aminopeptidase